MLLAIPCNLKLGTPEAAKLCISFCKYMMLHLFDLQTIMTERSINGDSGKNIKAQHVFSEIRTLGLLIMQCALDRCATLLQLAEIIKVSLSKGDLVQTYWEIYVWVPV